MNAALQTQQAKLIFDDLCSALRSAIECLCNSRLEELPDLVELQRGYLCALSAALGHAQSDLSRTDAKSLADLCHLYSCHVRRLGRSILIARNLQRTTGTTYAEPASGSIPRTSLSFEV